MLVTSCDYQTLHNRIVNLFMNRKCANFVLSGLSRAPSLILAFYFILGCLFFTLCLFLLFSSFFLVCVCVF